MTSKESNPEGPTLIAATDRVPTWLGSSYWATRTGVLGGVVFVGLLYEFWTLGGLTGLLAWSMLVCTWLFVPTVVVVAVGQFAIAAVTPVTVPLTTVLPVEALLLALLAIEILITEPAQFDRDDTLRSWLPTVQLLNGLYYVAVVAILTGGVLWAANVRGLVAAGLVGGLIVTTAAYFLHRYLLYTLRHLTASQDTAHGDNQENSAVENGTKQP